MTWSPGDTLVDYCYKRLKEAVIRGEFSPGEKLKIAKLKAILNVGPTPIREALSRLVTSGLIATEANRGFFVKQVSEEEVRDLYATFSKIELLALNQALDLGNGSWEANILAALHKLSLIEKVPPPVDIEKWLKLNYEFHYALIAGCGSPCLLKIRESLYQLFEQYCHLSLLLNQQMLNQNHQDHCAIAQAAISRDKSTITKLIKKHLEHSLEGVLAYLKKQ